MMITIGWISGTPFEKTTQTIACWNHSLLGKAFSSVEQKKLLQEVSAGGNHYSPNISSNKGLIKGHLTENPLSRCKHRGAAQGAKGPWELMVKKKHPAPCIMVVSNRLMGVIHPIVGPHGYINPWSWIHDHPAFQWPSQIPSIKKGLCFSLNFREYTPENPWNMVFCAVHHWLDHPLGTVAHVWWKKTVFHGRNV